MAAPRKQTCTPTLSTNSACMKEAELARYSRHLLLPEIDMEGQAILSQSRVLVVGLGGLGSPVAMYLVASGVGTLVLCDSDRVELANLQRQILHATSDIGRDKTRSAVQKLAALNPEVRLLAVPCRLQGDRLENEVRQANAVVDCSDNFSTRFELNAACVAARVPLISGSAVRMRGQVGVFRADRAPSPCYECLYPSTADQDENCAGNGVFAPLTGIVGSIQAAETLKVLLDLKGGLQGQLLQIDALAMRFRTARIRPDTTCSVCAAIEHPPLEERPRSG